MVDQGSREQPLFSSLDMSGSSTGQQIGRYTIAGLLGRGGMGAVFRARDEALGRQVAIKVLLQLDDPTLRERFAREARSVAAVRHPGIVALLDAGSERGIPYIVLELVEGETLTKRIERGLEPREAARIVAEVARAVAHAHAAGIVHRDLKPANVLLERDGRARVSDFGLARVAGEAANAISKSGQVVGTPEYMSPEQAASEPATELSDVYGVGAILYAALTGRPPHEGATPANVLFSILQKEPPSPRSLRPRVHVDLETICLKALEKDASRRYASAGELADDLERFLAGEPIEARPLGVLGRAWRRLRRKGALAFALVLLLAGAGVAVWLAVETARERHVLQERFEREKREREAAKARDERRERLREKIALEPDPAALRDATTVELAALAREAKSYCDSLGVEPGPWRAFLLERRLTALEQLHCLRVLEMHPEPEIVQKLVEDARALLALDPAHAPRWRFVLALDDSDGPAAVNSRLEDVVSADPASAYGIYAKAWLATRRGRPLREVQEGLTSALAASERAPDVRVFVCAALENTGRYDEATEGLALLLAPELRPRCEYAARKLASLLALARTQTLLRAGDREGALACIEESLAKFPAHPHSIAQRIDILVEMNRVDDALAVYRDAAGRGWADSDVHAQGIRAVASAGHPADALQLCDDLLRRYPRKVMILSLRSRVLMTLGRFAEGIATAEKALEYEPDNVTARALRACGLAAVGRLEEARAECVRILDNGGERTIVAIPLTKLKTEIDAALAATQKDGKPRAVRSTLDLR